MDVLFLFAVLIGALGTIIGAFFGSGFIPPLQVFPNIFLHALFGKAVGATIPPALEPAIFGVLFIVSTIYAPLGLARLWQKLPNRLERRPFKCRTPPQSRPHGRRAAARQGNGAGRPARMREQRAGRGP